MMKTRNKLFIVGFLVNLFTSASLYGQDLHKVFLDRDFKKTEYEDFASYYRVELQSSSTDIITYRLFSISGTLMAEGKAKSFDNDDYSNNVYVGENLIYFDNGKIEEYRLFETPGTVRDLYHIEVFDEKERVIWKGSMLDSKFSGEYLVYEDDYLRRHLLVEGGELNGECVSYYPDGNIESIMNYVNDIENGEYIMYYPSGEVERKGTMANGLLEGEYNEYNEHGRPIVTANQKNGLFVGKLVFDDLEYKHTFDWYEMKAPDNSPLFISVTPLMYEYSRPTSDRWGLPLKVIKTASGKRINGYADHYNLLRFDIQIRNLTNEPVKFDISDINVITVGKKGKEDGKVYSNNTIIKEDAVAMLVDHIKSERTSVIKKAKNKAEKVATTTSTSSTVVTGSSNTRVNSAGAAARVGAGYGAAVANGGRYVVGAGVNASVGVASSTTKSNTQAYGVSSTRSKSFNNALYYQTLEEEIDKARVFVAELKESSEEEVKRLDMAGISIPAHGYIQKEILASEDRGASIILEFKINGDIYSVTIAENLIPNYRDNY